jgi:excisionase family DNA binding protein
MSKEQAILEEAERRGVLPLNGKTPPAVTRTTPPGQMAQWLTFKEVADHLGTNVSTIRKYVRDGVFKSKHVKQLGRKTRIHRNEFDVDAQVMS